MKNFFSETMSDFWISIMEKLNTNRDQRIISPDILKELCEYFGFGCGFVYMADNREQFFLQGSYQLYHDENHLQPVIAVRQLLGQELYKELISRRYLVFDDAHEKAQLEQTFATEFHGKAMVMVPVVDRQNKLRALIGMVDRRGQTREGDQDIRFAYTMMAVIANYIKVMISQQENVGTMNVLTSVLDHTGMDVFVFDYYTNEILYANQSIEQRNGGRENIVIDKDLPKEKLVDDQMRPANTYRWNMYVEPSKQWMRVTAAAVYWVDGRLAIVSSSVDVTENKKNEEKIQHHAQYDEMTGLGNRHKLLLDCDDAVEALKDTGREGFLVFCDLNRFKQVNDTFGHDAGDELLTQIGTFLSEEPLTAGRTYRYGGDEFIILCLDYTQEQVDELIAVIEQRFTEAWPLKCGEIFCGTSMGITCYPKEADTTSDLLHAADKKMYEVKRTTR